MTFPRTFIALFHLLFILSCAQKTDTDEAFSKLSELPKELAARLGSSEDPSVLKTNPLKIAIPPRTQTVRADEPGPIEVFIEKYSAQFFYPITFCTSPSELFEQRLKALDTQADQSQAKKVYRLTTYEGAKPLHFMCTVKGGPYNAEVIKTESCNVGVPPHWELNTSSLLGIELSWWGLWEDVPSSQPLQIWSATLLLQETNSSCCHGYCATTQKCLLKGQECKSPFQQ